MRYVIFRKFLAVLFGLVLTATGLWASGAEEEPAAAMEKEMVTDPTTGEMVTAPQYGGTLTAVTPSDPAGSDAFFGHPTMKAIEQVCEMLAGIDWAVDRADHGLNSIYLPDFALKEGWPNAGRCPRTVSPLPSTFARAFTGMTRRR